MKILALDLGNRSGFACGVAGEGTPRLESWILKRDGQTPEVACRNLSCTLRDNIQLEEPDLVVIEMWMHPAAQPNADVIITHLQLHGAVEAIAGCYGIETRRATAAQYRRHFCGQPTAGTRRSGFRTARQRQEDRRATNDMVLKRAILLGYLPRDSTDWDKAAAAALFDYASAHWARKPPRVLHMFGERPREEEATR